MLEMRSRTTGLCIAVALAVAGCLGAAAAYGTATAGTSRHVGSKGPTASESAASETVDVIDLAAADLGLVGLGTVAQGTGSARLVLTTDNGRKFTDIGPKTAVDTSSNDVFFLNREDGWFVVYHISNDADTLYRTTNGGKTWHAYAAPGHVQAAGSADTVQFISPADGWLLWLEPTAPAEMLEITTNGGATWKVVSSLHPARGQGVLPELGEVRFEPNGTGWLGGGPYSQALYRTSDHGRTWKRVSISAPAGAVFGLPSTFGATLIEPVTVGTGLAIYRSTDSGVRWSKVSSLADAGTAGGCGPGGMLTVSIPALKVGWLASVRARRTVVYRTTDSGLHWARTGTGWPVPADSCEAPQLEAVSASQAWVIPVGTDHVYATGNGGVTWRRIDTAAVAAGG